MHIEKLACAAATMTLMTACDVQKDAPFVFDEVTYTPKATVFKLFAPDSSHVCVVLDGDSIEMAPQPTVDNAQGIYKATVEGDHKNKTYEFVVCPPAKNGRAGSQSLSSPGVFAKAVTVNGQKGVVVNLQETNPAGWASDRHVFHPWQDLVIYEMHHRDFSVGRDDAQYKGKFLALSEPWAIDHLKALGVNAVHILPSYDYGSVDETRLDEPQYNWGYDPVNYNVPEGSYSTNPFNPQCRIREFKQMVQALHKADIAVILDVVYNHTYDIAHSNFQHTYPDYYYRTTPNPIPGQNSSAGSLSQGGEPVYSNGSGCGNETASEQPMMRRFMVESVKYWVNEYHIDGFRFDLMGVHDITTMNTIRQALDSISPLIFMYGEGWSAGPCALPNDSLGMKANIPQMPRIAAFSDDMRDALRGPFSDDTKPGWLGMSKTEETTMSTDNAQDGEMAVLKESLKAGIAGMVEHPQVDYRKVNYSDKPYALEPTQMIAYVSCHDDMCLYDRLKASVSGLKELNEKSQISARICSPSESEATERNLKPQIDELIRLDLLAQTAVFTSQGVPFMLSGEELLRTKQGVHNSFESPDSINRLDWTNKERYPQVFDYYSRLIALRKAHPAFRLGKADLVRKHLEFLSSAEVKSDGQEPLNADDRVVAYRLKDHAGGDPWQDIIVILNADSEARTVAIPDGRYTVVCCDGKIDAAGLGEVNGSKVQVAPQSALIIHN